MFFGGILGGTFWSFYHNTLANEEALPNDCNSFNDSGNT